MARSPTKPALQTQSPRRLLPVAFVVELEGQSVQIVPPSCVMYVPDWQASHVLLLGAPEAVEKVPGRQLMHGEAMDAVDPGLDGLGKILIIEYHSYSPVMLPYETKHIMLAGMPPTTQINGGGPLTSTVISTPFESVQVINKSLMGSVVYLEPPTGLRSSNVSPRQAPTTVLYK